MDILLSPSFLSAASLVILLAAVLWLRMPIAVLLAVLGFCGLWAMNGAEAARALVSNELWGNFSSYGLTVIPLFILMGQACFWSGLNERLYRSLNTIAGHVPGGLAVATLLACGGFAAICGSNTATAATMASVAMPEMKRYGYDESFSAGTVATGATLGVIIPPSVVLIIIAIQTGLSVSDLFVASVVPGVILVAAFIACAQIAVLRHPEWAPRREKAPLAERLRALPGLCEALILFGGVLGGMSAGIVTPTEAGALGSLIAIAMGFATRRLTLKGLANAFSDTLRLSAMILLLVAGAMIYGKFLTATRLPFELSGLIRSMSAPSWVVLACMLAVFLVGGMVMDALALLLIAVPIFFPLAQTLGFGPVWFAVLITVVTTIGAVTPPVGVCSYVVSSMNGGIPLPGVFRGVFLYMPAYAFTVLLLMLAPCVL